MFYCYFYNLSIFFLLRCFSFCFLLLFCIENNTYNVKFTIVKLILLKMYKVRVLLDDLRKTEKIEMCSSYNDAVDRFLFYVHLALEFNCSVRCVNIFYRKKSIRLFQNH